jgi:hypothetical protein
MSKTAFAAVLAILISGLAQAQTQTQVQTRVLPLTQTSEERPFHVYALAGLGHSSGGSNQFQIGGGADAFVFNGVSIGGEFSHATGQAGFNLFSANGNFHFLTRDKFGRFDPFAGGGYSRFFASGVGANAANFGGGLNYWLSDGFGLRFDLRDHVNGNGSFVGLRGGVVLAF